MFISCHFHVLGMRQPHFQCIANREVATTSFVFFNKPHILHVRFVKLYLAEMITIRFAGWISGRTVSFQPDKDIQKLLSNGNRIRIRYPKRFYQYFEDSDFWKKLHIAQSFIYYLQKHLFSLLHHDSESAYGVNSEP